jgi:hypothetical protein
MCICKKMAKTNNRPWKELIKIIKEKTNLPLIMYNNIHPISKIPISFYFSLVSHAMIKLQTSSFNIFKLLFLLLLLSPAPSIVSGEFTCDGETMEKNKGEALKYKIALFATILFTVRWG